MLEFTNDELPVVFFSRSRGVVEEKVVWLAQVEIYTRNAPNRCAVIELSVCAARRRRTGAAEDFRFCVLRLVCTFFLITGSHKTKEQTHVQHANEQIPPRCEVSVLARWSRTGRFCFISRFFSVGFGFVFRAVFDDFQQC